MADYYLGLDIGDGETAVAVLTEESVAPQMVHLGYKDASILSAVGLDEQKNIIIGENVVLLPKVEGQTVRFKSRFLNDAGARADLLRFAQGLAQALQTHSGLMNSQNQLLMTVGCPTGEGWLPEIREHYAGIIRQALPINEAPVGESRAAFLYTKYGGDGQVPQHMLNGNVLVIDMGSSTTDLAYIVEGKDCTMNVFGASCLGGGLIDQMLLDWCVEQHPLKEELRSLFQRVPSLRHRCEVTARKIKEAYFTAQTNGTDDSFKQSKSEVLFYKNTRADFTRLVFTLNTFDENGVMNMDAATNMDALLDLPLPATETENSLPPAEKPSFRASVNALLADAVDKTQKNPPELIILTGGASKMPFFQEAVRSYFPDTVISCCEHPEYSIACGLAFACRVDSRMEKFRKAIHIFTDSHKFEVLLEQSLPSLISSLCDTLAPLFIDQLFMPALSRYGKKLRKDDEASNWRVQFFKSPDVKTKLSSILKSWAANGLAPLTKEITNICLRYKVSTDQLPIPTPEQLRMELPSFELNVIIDVLLRIPLIGTGIQALLKPRYVTEARKAMKELLEDRTGTFYISLRNELKETLKKEIDERAKKVEIPIV